MSNLVAEIDSPISTPSPMPSPERNSRGCLTNCPACGEALPPSNNASPISLVVSSNNAAPNATPLPAPAKKGLLGIGFLGLGGRRRRTARRRRSTHRRRTGRRTLHSRRR